ncbi:MAG: hypothetical protein OCC45_04490 [Desulfotalea sp.]
MEIKCISTEEHFFKRTDSKEGNLPPAKHNQLTLNKIYEVYGMISVRGRIRYLLLTDFNTTTFFSADLFIVTDSFLPLNWHYKFLGHNEYEIVAIWGYYELVYSGEHFNGLVDQNPSDFEIFEKQLEERLRFNIKKYIKELENNLDEDSVKDTKLYLENHEYEMAYEVFMIGLVKNNPVNISIDFHKLKAIAKELNLHNETIFDGWIWRKFEKWGEKINKCE